MSQQSLPSYTPVQFRRLLVRHRADFVQHVLEGFNFFVADLRDLHDPKDALANARDLLRVNEATRKGHHTFISEPDLIEFIGSNIGMAIAMLALAGPASQQFIHAFPPSHMKPTPGTLN